MEKWPDWLRGLFFRALAIFLSVSLVCVVTEVGLRLFWDGFYLKTQKAYAQPHPQRGWSNRPEVSVPYGEPEFSTTVTHNQFGYRTHPISRVPSADRVRVLVLGDSFTYGVGVEDDETFSARLEGLAPEIEAINTGVNGYGSAQELLLLRDEGIDLAPDVVIVTFFWNDVGNNLRENAARFRLEDGVLRYPDPQPELAAVSSAPPPSHREWLRYSYTYRFVSDRAKMLGFWLKVVFGIPLEETDFVDDGQREQAWDLEFAILREMRRLSQEAGAEFLLVVIPDQVQLDTDVEVLGLEPSDYEVQERLEAFARSEGMPMLDLIPALRAAAERNPGPLYYRRDRHLRPPGHVVMARAILAELEARGWLETRQSKVVSRATALPGGSNQEMGSNAEMH